MHHIPGTISGLLVHALSWIFTALERYSYYSYFKRSKLKLEMMPKIGSRTWTRVWRLYSPLTPVPLHQSRELWAPVLTLPLWLPACEQVASCLCLSSLPSLTIKGDAQPASWVTENTWAVARERGRSFAACCCCRQLWILWPRLAICQPSSKWYWSLLVFLTWVLDSREPLKVGLSLFSFVRSGPGGRVPRLGSARALSQGRLCCRRSWL